MSNFDFPDTYLNSQTPGQNGPLFTMSRDEILGNTTPRSGGDTGERFGREFNKDRKPLDATANSDGEERQSRLRHLPGVTYGERRRIATDTSTGETSREQLLGAMVAGAQAGAQHVVDTTPEPVLGPLSAVGANVITGAAAGVAETIGFNPSPVDGNVIALKQADNQQPLSEVELLLEGIRNVGPLGEFLVIDDDNPTPFGYFAGFTAGTRGTFLLHDPESGRTALYQANKIIAVRPSPTTAISASSVGIINDQGRIDIGGGLVFLIDPEHLPTALVYVNARGFMDSDDDTNVSVFPDADGISRIAVTVGAGLSPEQTTSILSQHLASGLRLVPSLHTQVAAQKLDSLANAINTANQFARTFIGAGIPMELQHDSNTGEITLHHRGNEVTPEYLMEVFFGGEQPRLRIPSTGLDENPVFLNIADHLHLLDGRSPFEHYHASRTTGDHPALEVAAQVRQTADNLVPMYFPMLSEEARNVYAHGIQNYDQASVLMQSLYHTVLPEDRQALLNMLNNPYVDFGVPGLEELSRQGREIALPDGTHLIQNPPNHDLIQGLLVGEWSR